MQPHEERVVAERDELNEKRRKLEAFITGPVFPTLPQDERCRLMRQAAIMLDYGFVLTERICAFPSY